MQRARLSTLFAACRRDRGNRCRPILPPLPTPQAGIRAGSGARLSARTAVAGRRLLLLPRLLSRGTQPVGHLARDCRGEAAGRGAARGRTPCRLRHRAAGRAATGRTLLPGAGVACAGRRRPEIGRGSRVGDVVAGEAAGRCIDCAATGRLATDQTHLVAAAAFRATAHCARRTRAVLRGEREAGGYGTPPNLLDTDAALAVLLLCGQPPALRTGEFVLRMPCLGSGSD